MKNIIDYAHFYIGCPIIHDGKISTLQSVSSNGLIGDENRDDSGEGWYHIDDCMIALRRLSDITNEEAIRFSDIKEKHTTKLDRSIKTIAGMAEITNYLRSIGVDCDGLIEAGLAIDATTIPVTQKTEFWRRK